MDWNKFWGLFHEAWGKAKDSPFYDSKIWNEMQDMLHQVQGKEGK